MELKIKKKRVLEAAEECPLAKSVLKKIFPEAFKKDKRFKMGSLFRLIPAEGRAFNAMLVNSAMEGDYGLYTLIDIDKGMRVTIQRVRVHVNRSDDYITPKEFLSLIPDGYDVWELNPEDVYTMSEILNKGLPSHIFEPVDLKKLKYL